MQSQALDTFQYAVRHLQCAEWRIRSCTARTCRPALCRAINHWIAAEWLDRDPRLRASIVVPVHSAELAAEEIDRCAADKRFVQVLMLAMTELPLGRRQNWPIYRAAERHDLPIGIHAGSSFRHPPSAIGWPSYYLEDYVSQAPGFAAALNSLVTEGVFVKFPRLKVVLIESGVTWLPAYLWRINKTWRGVRAETPWLDRPPSEIIREHVRLTIQPFDDPDEAKPGRDHHRGDRLRRDAAVLDRLSALALRGHRRRARRLAARPDRGRSWSITRWKPIRACPDATDAA